MLFIFQQQSCVSSIQSLSCATCFVCGASKVLVSLQHVPRRSHDTYSSCGRAPLAHRWSCQMHPAVDMAVRVVAWWNGRASVNAVRDAGLVFATAVQACWALLAVWCTTWLAVALWARSMVARTCTIVILGFTGAAQRTMRRERIVRS